jgi:hypothetical protein
VPARRSRKEPEIEIEKRQASSLRVVLLSENRTPTPAGSLTIGARIYGVEVGHARSNAGDVSPEFEAELTQLMGTVASKALW